MDLVENVSAALSVRSAIYLVLIDLDKEFKEMHSQFPEYTGISWEALSQAIGDYARKNGISQIWPI